MSRRYLISDLHLDHENIIDYCNRPFEDVEEMNETLVANWNDAITPNDEVIFGGDLTISGTAADFLTWIEQLNGEIVFIVGNHDRTVIDTLDRVTILDHYQFSHRGYEFYCTHRPEDVPANWDGWAVFGHHHNNYPEALPLFDPEHRHINISAELLAYEPLDIEAVVEFIEQNEQIDSVG